MMARVLGALGSLMMAILEGGSYLQQSVSRHGGFSFQTVRAGSLQWLLRTKAAFK